MRENKDQKNSAYGRFSPIDCLPVFHYFGLRTPNVLHLAFLCEPKPYILLGKQACNMWDLNIASYLSMHCPFFGAFEDTFELKISNTVSFSL